MRIFRNRPSVQAARPRKAGRQSGFTLLELLIVLIIMGLTAAVATASFKPGTHAEFRTMRDALVSELRLARSEAVARGTPTTMTINPKERWFERSGGRRYRMGEETSLAIISAREAGRDGNEAAIRFFPNGECTGARIRLSGGGDNVEILVHWRTGLVLFPDSDHEG
ncbi:GspH/FimT family pseudopilin [Inquilinus limosus]|uniref:GspH/FimT family pseudopilin n=1 Tax=Inquilinus limosus TaxID=171674 RepID=UPI003F148312